MGGNSWEVSAQGPSKQEPKGLVDVPMPRPVAWTVLRSSQASRSRDWGGTQGQPT